MYILISGNTGAGKTTAAECISKKYNLRLYCDPFLDNPFLKQAFAPQDNTAFQSQLFFFKEFLRIHKIINESTQSILQERSIFETVRIFCNLFHKIGLFSRDELDVFNELYNEVIAWMRLPDLIIYIKSDVEINSKRIMERGRSFEARFSKDMLLLQDSLYDNWIDDMRTRGIGIITMKNDINIKSKFESDLICCLNKWIREHGVSI